MSGFIVFFTPFFISPFVAKNLFYFSKLKINFAFCLFNALNIQDTASQQLIKPLHRYYRPFKIDTLADN